MIAIAARIANTLADVSAEGFNAALLEAVEGSPVAALRGAAKIARARAGWRIARPLEAERHIAIATLLEAAADNRAAA